MKSFLKNERTIVHLVCGIEYRHLNMLNSQKYILKGGKKIN